MPQAFEEWAVQEIDSLYQGALFLSGGDEDDAEELLISAVTGGFHAYPRRNSAGVDSRWFEARLVKRFLAGRDDEAAEGRDVEASVAGGADLAGLGAADLHRAARAVPPRARGALWLVVLRRWSYDEAARVMEIDREALVDLLAFRHAFVAAALKSRAPKNGTDFS